jgi:signal transduction histidine kinase
MAWAERLFDRRATWVRMLLLDLSGLSYLLFDTRTSPRPAGQWWLAVVAFAAALTLWRWPVAGLLAQCGLLAVSFVLLDDPTISQVGASWALVEVAMWARRPRTIWLCAGLLFAIYLVQDIVLDPSPLPAVLFGVLVLPIGPPLLLGLVIRTTRELARQAEQRTLAERQRTESENRAARADERSTIARELHDVVAHHVASMVLRVGVARHVLPGPDPRVTEVFDDVHRTGTAALADLRRLVEVLRDPAAARGDAALTAIEPGALPAALGAAVETARRTGLTVEADIDEAVGTLDAVRGLAVLRLTQEALTNVAKHAGTTARARLRVAVADGNVSWEVADDGGSAPDAASTPPGGGHGITGMRERVEVLGGRLTAGPSGTGWRVGTVLPAEAAA